MAVTKTSAAGSTERDEYIEIAQPELRLAAKYARNHCRASRPSGLSDRTRSQASTRSTRRPAAAPGVLLTVTSLGLLANHRLEAVEAFVESRLELGVLRLSCLTLSTRDKRRGDRGRDDGDERDALEHHECADEAAGHMLWRDVAITDGRHRLYRPPHADPDARVFRVIEDTDQDAAADHHERRCRHDHARRQADRGPRTQKLRHSPLDRVRSPGCPHRVAEHLTARRAWANRVHLRSEKLFGVKR